MLALFGMSALHTLLWFGQKTFCVWVKKTQQRVTLYILLSFYLHQWQYKQENWKPLLVSYPTEVWTARGNTTHNIQYNTDCYLVGAPGHQYFFKGIFCYFTCASSLYGQIRFLPTVSWYRREKQQCWRSHSEKHLNAAIVSSFRRKQGPTGSQKQLYRSHPLLNNK